ncbi:MAG: hypothetical protein DRI94_13875 [Bacteroidetes bacterium]|nr:MAG: hypothetical protein DRI94_13875 [Bacteroidota bacterium]
MRITILILILVSNMCFAQKYIAYTFDEKMYDEFLDELGLPLQDIKSKKNTVLDTSDFIIRIWKNGVIINKVKLWQIKKEGNKFKFEEYIYTTTVGYSKNPGVGQTKYVKWDSLTWRILPIFGGNCFVEFAISDVRKIIRDDVAKYTYNELKKNRLLELNNLRFNYGDTATINGETIFIDGVLLKPIGSDYTCELISNNYYLQFNFPNPEYYDEYSIYRSEQLFYSNQIIKILEKK